MFVHEVKHNVDMLFKVEVVFKVDCVLCPVEDRLLKVDCVEEALVTKSFSSCFGVGDWLRPQVRWLRPLLR